MELKITIIGGAGAMGRWFARFFTERGWEVTICDIDAGVSSVANELGVSYADDPISAVKQSDVTLISVPIDSVVNVIEEIAPHIEPGSLLMDVTSVKKAPVEAMQKYAPEGVEIIGTHPMFAPSIKSMQAHVIIFTPVKEGHWLPIIKELFEESGANVEIADAGQHDRMMAVIQGLTHFAYIAIGATLKEIDFDVEGSRKFMSPVYEIMLDFVGRILAQNPELYAMIQTNLPVEEIHNTFISKCEYLLESIQKKDAEAVMREIENARKHFGDIERALKDSDKLIELNVLSLQGKEGDPDH